MNKMKKSTRNDRRSLLITIECNTYFYKHTKTYNIEVKLWTMVTDTDKDNLFSVNLLLTIFLCRIRSFDTANSLYLAVNRLLHALVKRLFPCFVGIIVPFILWY